MATLTVAAVQATYVLMDREATIDRVAELTSAAAGQGAQLVVFPEVFVPGTPIWIDTRPIWDGDDEWFTLLAENAVVIPSPATERLAGIAAEHQVWLVVGVEERAATGSTIYNTLLYFSPNGRLVDRHRKLVPTGSERTVWGMGDGSTLRVVDADVARIGGLICWETTCRWPGSTSTPKAWTSGWHPRSRRATAGSARCSTWPGRTGCTSSA